MYQNFDYDSYMKYLQMFRKMDTIRSFLIANKVSELGLPQFSEHIPTAGVGIHPVSKGIVFVFNKKFFDLLDVDSLAFVFVHEMLHPAFGHITRFNALIGKAPDEHSKPSEFLEHQYKAKLWNIAADCIVNIWCEYLGFPATEFVDILLGSTDEKTGKFTATIDPVTGKINSDKIDEKTGQIRRGLCFADRIGYPNFNGSTSADDIYHWLLRQNKEDMQKLMDAMDDHSNWVVMDGPASDEFSEQVAGSMNPEFFSKAAKDMNSKEAKEMEQKAKNAKAKSDSFLDNFNPKSYGKGTNSELRHYELLRGRAQNDVLQKIHRKIKSFHDTTSKETWTRPPKKLITQWPNILIPTDWNQEDKAKFHALLCIDSSGSITDGHISQFVRWARSFPMDKIEYEPMAFDDKPYTLVKSDFYNRDKYPAIPGRGGTNISLPEYYAQKVFQKRHKRRPDLIIVLTDGEGSTEYSIAPEHQSSYLWVMVHGASHGKEIVRKYCPNGTIFDTNIA